MEAYQPVVAKRMKGLIALNGVFALVTILTAIYGGEAASGAEDFVRGIQLGVFIGMEAGLLYLIMKLGKVLKNPQALKMMYIEEKDERNNLIKLHSRSAGLNIVVFGMAFAAILSGFFNHTVSIALFGALLFILAVNLATKEYYKKKY